MRRCSSMLCCFLALGLPTLGVGAESGLSLQYHEAWYLENGLHDLDGAAEAYSAVAERGAEEPAVAAKAMLRKALCFRQMGRDEAAGDIEVLARRQFPREIENFPSSRLEVIHKRISEAFDTAGSAAATRTIIEFLESIEPAAVHSVCESFYGEAFRQRERDPVASIPAYQKAIAISTYLRQLDRSAFALKDVGDILADAGRHDAALAAYRKLQEDFPHAKGPAAWAQLGIAEIHRFRGQLPEAVAAYRAVERNYPSQVTQGLWANLWLGDTFREAGKLADARSAWRRALEEFNEPAYAAQIAVAARLLGQAPDQRVRMPKDEFANDIAYFLGVQYEMAGDVDRARRHYERCIELSRGNDWPRPLAARAMETGGGTAQP
ncbi:tetratricopeptide repeat protein [bacterium]|nr:tetratricopeptide repeat protein [bacterium]